MTIAYSETERTRALELYTQHGPAEAARRTGIRSGTIRQWALRGGVTVTRSETATRRVQAARLTWAQRRGELVTALGEAAAEFVADARKTVAAGDRVKHMTGAGIAIDKAQLLSGDATQRIETSDQFNREVGRLLGEFDRRDEPQPAQPAA